MQCVWYESEKCILFQIRGIYIYLLHVYRIILWEINITGLIRIHRYLELF